MDTGHTNKAVSAARECGIEIPGIAESIRMFGKDLAALHLNDNNGYSDQHTPPGVFASFGGVAWAEVMQALEDVGYRGTYSFELALDGYGDYLDRTVTFLGGYLRAFLDGKLA